MGAHYVSGNCVMRHSDRAVISEYSSHWAAVQALLTLPEDEEPDAYGRTGARSDCWCCGATGVEYGETCVTCGGYGWVRDAE